MEPTFNSLNLQTGMLEDINEIRALGLDLVETIKLILGSPAAIFIPREVLGSIAVYAVKAESVLRFMTQKEQYELMNQVTGVPDPFAQIIAETSGGLSDTLPSTHPEARRRLLEGMLSNPMIPEEIKEMARRDGEDLLKDTGPVSLPDSLENFLRQLGGNEKEE